MNIDELLGPNGLATKAQGDKADTALQPADASSFATASQGILADSATQPADLHAVATSGDYADLTNKPTIPTVDDTAYDEASWNGSMDAPTKNAIRDKLENMGSGGADAGAVFGLSLIFGG